MEALSLVSQISPRDACIGTYLGSNTKIVESKPPGKVRKRGLDSSCRREHRNTTSPKPRESTANPKLHLAISLPQTSSQDLFRPSPDRHHSQRSNNNLVRSGYMHQKELTIKKAPQNHHKCKSSISRIVRKAIDVQSLAISSAAWVLASEGAT